MVHSAELERLAARVRTAARGDGLIETAQVKLVGLDEVRMAAGARWPRMREHVRDGSIRLISARIGPDDAVIPAGDGFLIVFAHDGEEQVERRCKEINDALIAFYLGEDALKAVRADVERETVPAAKLAGIVSSAAPAAHVLHRRNELKLGRFWPVWSLRRGAVNAHICAPVIETGAQARLGYASDFLDKAAHRDCDFVDMDLCLLEQACAAAEHPESGPIGVTVHATTLQARKSRNLYLDHVAANAAPVRQRMFIMISEIAPGTPLISLSEWSNALKHTFSRIALDLHHTDRALSALGSAGVWGAGYHLPAGRHGSSQQLRAQLNELEAWCRTLRRQGIQPFVHGVSETAFLDLAAYSDLAFATGEALWPSSQAPTAVQGLVRAAAG